MIDPTFTWMMFILGWGAWLLRKSYLRGRRDGRKDEATTRPASPGLARTLAEPASPPPPPTPMPAAPDEGAIVAARTRAAAELVAMGFPADMVARGVAACRDTDPRVIRQRVALTILRQ